MSTFKTISIIDLLIYSYIHFQKAKEKKSTFKTWKYVWLSSNPLSLSLSLSWIFIYLFILVFIFKRNSRHINFVMIAKSDNQFQTHKIEILKLYSQFQLIYFVLFLITFKIWNWKFVIFIEFTCIRPWPIS